MPDQNTDRDTTWELTGNNQVWTVGENATINVFNTDYGIEDKATGSRINIQGTVYGYEAAVVLGSSSATLNIASQGYLISGIVGVQMHEFGNLVVNDGFILDCETAISGTMGIVENNGIIEGRYGIYFETGAYVVDNTGDILGWNYAIAGDGGGTVINAKGGRIEGGDSALNFYGDQLQKITNAGVIKGWDSAISSEAPIQLRNTGGLIGDVLLGDGADRIDTRGGFVRGRLMGGEGDDLYLISDASVLIADYGSSTEDTVRSTVSYTLTGGLDHLQLLGSRNTDATATSGHNDLQGNKGDNRLSSGEGNDYLDGGAGNDRLMGGSGADTFEFQKGYDRDRIMDFTDGTDLLSVGRVTTQRQFDRLDIRQVGADTVIDLGHGDRLTIEDVAKNMIDFGDFSVS
jgi:Ca2+-binding RTX toxin-like protein